MNTNSKTTISEGAKLANTNRQTAIKESKMKITTPKLIRWAGLSAMVAGIIFAGIQPIHPPDVLSSVNTSLWAILTYLKTAMSIFGLLGIAGIYARQVEKTGWLGLAGYLSLSIFYAVQMCLLVSVLYMLGNLLFGIAMFRARILSRWAAGLLAFSGPLAVIMVALLPHQLERLAAMPMGIALAWLGYSLLSERREPATEPVPSRASTSSAKPEPSKVA